MRLGLFAALVAAGLASPAAAAEQVLLLEVHVNGRPVAQIGEFTLNDDQLFASRAELRELGLESPAQSATGPDDLVLLSTLPGFSFRLDFPRQAIYLSVADRLLAPAILRPGAEVSKLGKVETGTGMTLDYDVTGSVANGHATAAGRIDLRAFSPWGIISSGVLTYSGGGSNSSVASIVRLDTNYVFSNAATLYRVRIGDFISGGLSWTRPVRLGGAQFSLDFGLRPDLVTFPLPSVSGSAAVPSTIDVLVNGTRLFSREVEAGPFTIPQLPVVTGAGTISTTVTNALGRQVVTNLPFYAISTLLAPGLQSFSLQAGALRRNFGVLSNDYRRIAASGTYRRGLTDRLTIEGSGETTKNIVVMGFGAVFNAGNIAVINAAAAASNGSAGFGTQLSFGAQRTSGRISLSGSVSVAGRRYRDLAADYGDPAPRLQINASAGWTLGRFGSIGLAYVGIKRDAIVGKDVFGPSIEPPAQTPATVNGLTFIEPAQKAYVASASYSVQINRLSVFATGFRDFACAGGSGVLIGMALPLGRRSSVSMDASASQSTRTVQMQAKQSAVAIGDWGYEIATAPVQPRRAFASVTYKAPFALVSAGIDYSADTTTLRSEAQGSVSFIDGDVFASNTIYDSFAVVDTNGLAGVHVRNENRDVGITSAKGRLLVPELRSFDVNHLSIEPNDVPLDTVMDTAIRQVRPQERSGIIVNFRVQLSHAALLRLVGDDGEPVPIGSTARLAHRDPVPIGYGGEAYLPDLSDQNDVQVERSDGGRCVVRFEFKPIGGEVPIIGPLRCLEQTP